MSIRRLLRQSVEIHNTVITRDGYGNAVSSAGRTAVVRGFLDRTGSTESTDDRDTVSTTATLFLPRGTVIGYLDYVVVDGRRYQVQAVPHAVFNPRTASTSHIECQVQEVV